MKVYTYTNLEFEMVYAYSLKIEIVPLEYLLIHKLKSIKRIFLQHANYFAFLILKSCTVGIADFQYYIFREFLLESEM